MYNKSIFSNENKKNYNKCNTFLYYNTDKSHNIDIPKQNDNEYNYNIKNPFITVKKDDNSQITDKSKLVIKKCNSNNILFKDSSINISKKKSTNKNQFLLLTNNKSSSCIVENVNANSNNSNISKIYNPFELKNTILNFEISNNKKSIVNSNNIDRLIPNISSTIKNYTISSCDFNYANSNKLNIDNSANNICKKLNFDKSDITNKNLNQKTDNIYKALNERIMINNSVDIKNNQKKQITNCNIDIINYGNSSENNSSKTNSMKQVKHTINKVLIPSCMYTNKSKLKYGNHKFVSTIPFSIKDLYTNNYSKLSTKNDFIEQVKKNEEYFKLVRFFPEKPFKTIKISYIRDDYFVNILDWSLNGDIAVCQKDNLSIISHKCTFISNNLLKSFICSNKLNIENIDFKKASNSMILYNLFSSNVNNNNNSQKSYTSFNHNYKQPIENQEFTCVKYNKLYSNYLYAGTEGGDMFIWYKIRFDLDYFKKILLTYINKIFENKLNMCNENTINDNELYKKKLLNQIINDVLIILENESAIENYVLITQINICTDRIIAMDFINKYICIVGNKTSNNFNFNSIYETISFNDNIKVLNIKSIIDKFDEYLSNAKSYMNLFGINIYNLINDTINNQNYNYEVNSTCNEKSLIYKFNEEAKSLHNNNNIRTNSPSVNSDLINNKTNYRTDDFLDNVNSIHTKESKKVDLSNKCKNSNKNNYTYSSNYLIEKPEMLFNNFSILDVLVQTNNIHKDSILCILLLGTNTIAISSSDKSISLYNLIKNETSNLESNKYSKNSTSIALDKLKSEYELNLIYHIEDAHKSSIKTLSFYNNTENNSVILASGGGIYDKTIKFWDIKSKVLKQTINCENQILSIKFVENKNKLDKSIKQYMISSHGHIQNEIIIWGINYSIEKTIQLKVYYNVHKGRVLSICISPDMNDFISIGPDANLFVWRLNNTDKSDLNSECSSIIDNIDKITQINYNKAKCNNKYTNCSKLQNYHKNINNFSIYN